MKLRRYLSILLPAMLLSLLVGVANAASGNGVHDDGKFFSDGAVAQATKIIDQIDQKHQKDLLVDTIASVPDDQQAQLQSEGKEAFFHNFAIARAKAAGVNGVYILVCKDPTYLYVDSGKNTRQRAFTGDNVSTLRTKLVAAFKQKQFDQGLIDGATYVEQQMDANGTAASSGGAMSSPTPGPSGNSFPAIPRTTQNQNWGIGGIACALIAIVFGIVALRGIFGRSRGGGYYPQQGGYYPPQQGGGYPQQGGGYYPQQGGGSGFGKGFLGGLLGGAVGGYAADRFMHPGQQSSGYVPPSGGDAGGGGSFGGAPSGPDFGGGGDAGAGGDFGGGGGGGDFGGGGGGDSGGGGGSGGDF